MVAESTAENWGSRPFPLERDPIGLLPFIGLARLRSTFGNPWLRRVQPALLLDGPL